MIQFIRLVLEDLLLHVLPFLNAGNLCQLKFVNNEDLPNNGNLDFTLRQGGKVSPRKSVVQSACQYDVTSRVSDFQNGDKVFIEETDKNFDFITEIPFQFLGFGDFKVSSVIEN